MTKEISNSLHTAFNKASFLLDKHPIEKSEFIKKNVEILIKLLTDSNSKRGIILHQGTYLLLYFAAVLACFKSFLSDDTDLMSIIDELSEGDLVIYENKRGEFKGRDNEGRLIIENYDRGTLTINRVPVSLANKISPYYGCAKSLDGRGVKNKAKANKFISNLFDINYRDIKSVINKSVVVVCEKQTADGFMELFSIMVNGIKINFGELFPSAYLTPNDIHYYSGNSARVEPLLKFTSKLSVARELIIDNREIETLIIDGAKYFSEDISELTSIYNRSSLKTIILLGELYSGFDSSVFSNLKNIKTFFWTKEKLLDFIQVKKFVDENVCKVSTKLRNMINNFLNIKIDIFETKITLSNNMFFECKSVLHQLIKHKDSNEKIKAFIIKGYWLINLLERSFFPIATMEKLIIEGDINALSPTKELNNMQKIATEFSGSPLERKMLEVISMLIKIKNDLYNVNPKFENLVTVFYQNKHKRKNISVVGAKTYYQKIFMEAAPNSLRETIRNCDFYTLNNFNSDILYQNVIIIGMYDWVKFNPFLLSNTKKVTFLLYPNEKDRLIQAEAYTKKRLLMLSNNRQVNIKGKKVISEMELNGKADDIPIEDELEKFTKQFAFNYALTEMQATGTGGLQTSEIKRVAILETGEKVFFSKYYVPFVYEIESQSVVESDVSSLKPGDLLIFTNYDNDTRDIIERVMDLLLESKNCDEWFNESYEKSLYWKRALKEYMEKNNLSYKDLSKRMKKFGMRKHEVTLRSWLDERNYIVGPRDSESYKLIARITNDPKILKNPDSFYESCREVRSMRVRILKYIGKNIVQTYNKNSDSHHDEILSELPIDISKMSRLIQIDKIIDVDNLIIASHNANRPQNI